MPGIGGKDITWDEMLSRTETRLTEVIRRSHDETTSEKAREANAGRVVELTARVHKLKEEGPTHVVAGISAATEPEEEEEDYEDDEEEEDDE